MLNYRRKISESIEDNDMKLNDFKYDYEFFNF